MKRVQDDDLQLEFVDNYIAITKIVRDASAITSTLLHSGSYKQDKLPPTNGKQTNKQTNPTHLIDAMVFGTKTCRSNVKWLTEFVLM